MNEISLIYEIKNNPFFNSSASINASRPFEFVQPGEINDILRALKQSGYNVSMVDGPHELLKSVEIIKLKKALIFNKSIGSVGLERKIHVPAICNLFNLNYIGTSAYPMTLTRHKYHTNRLLNGVGFLVPNALMISNINECSNLRELAFPIIIKPNHESDALGIDDDSVYYEFSNKLLEHIEQLLNVFQQPVIIEEFISGIEIKVSVVGQPAKAVGCVNTLRNGIDMTNRIQSRNSIIKSELSYAPLSGKIADNCMSIAEKIHNGFGLLDYSRCDFRLDGQNNIYCMEVSTHPELSRDSSFANASFEVFGSYNNIISAIVSSARNRYYIKS